MKIRDIRDGMSNIEVVATVVEKDLPRRINTKFGSKLIGHAILQDDTGTIELVLWGRQTKEFQKGDKIKIEGAFARTFKDRLQLNVPKKGKIEVIE